jgi:hypothetical protein
MDMIGKHIANQSVPLKDMLDWLTKDELDALAVERSYDWCGTNWEDKERFRIEQILEARTQPSTKKFHPFKKLLSFLFP